MTWEYAGTLTAAGVAAAVAAIVNSIAGGGTLLTFPSLLGLGFDGKVANATSTVGLWPGSLGGALGYRREIRDGRRELLILLGPSLLGATVGSLLLFVVSNAVFDTLVPWLILGATVLFAVQPAVTHRLQQYHGGPAPVWVVVGLQFAVAVYGGFFGAGIGILMLAVLGLLGIDDIHRRNGVKNVTAAVINGVAAAVFS
ncbi:MAG: sulfite exporter TauE/SafE family protein, partial [Planctomycetia bacterium]